MDYNSSRKDLVLPEYGRNIHKMVDYALTIEDKEKRNKIVKSIIAIMGSMFPHLRDVNDFKHKLWDHIAIISDFKLDLESPYQLMTKEKLQEKPKRLPYNNKKLKFRHYGKTVESLVNKAVEIEDKEEREALVILIIKHMKKSFYNWNKDNITDNKVIGDIKLLSGGKLELDKDFKIPEQRDFYHKRKKVTRPDNKRYYKK